MKYCVSSRVRKSTLSKADEIKFAYRDRKAIPDYFEEYPDADIILQCSYADEIDWEEIKTFNVLGRGHFILCLSKMEDLQNADQAGYRYYYGIPLHSAYELNIVASKKVEYVCIDAPLFFKMDYVKSQGKPVRIVANIAYKDALPRENGVAGVWVRPEDLNDTYAEYIAAIEFEEVEIEKEELLFRVFAEDHEWRQDLKLIINGLRVDGSNRLISKRVAENRLNCGQRCEEGGSCRICYRELELANAKKLSEYAEEVYPELLNKK